MKGVDSVRFRLPTSAERRNAREQLKLSDEVHTLCFIGRISRDKGLRLFAPLMTQLRKSGNFRLILIGGFEGDSTDEESFRELTARDDVEYIGVVPNPEDYLAACDLLVMPSSREGLSTVILEAGAMGIPSVASDVDGVRELFFDPVVGRLVTSGEVGDWIPPILELMDRRSTGSELRDRVLERFDAVAVNARWVRYLDDLAGK